MATVFTHAVLASALAPLGPPGVSRRRAALALACVSVAPDLDVVAFPLGIPYEHPLGHRGLSHSFAFALLLAAAVTRFGFAGLAPGSRPWWRLFALLFVATASHGVLDSLSNGGRGIGFLLPFSSERFFAPIRPLPVPPIGWDPIVLDVLATEISTLWLPALALLGLCWIATRRRAGDTGPRRS